MRYLLERIRERLKSLRSLQGWHERKAQEEGLSEWGRGFCEGKADALKAQRREWGEQYRALRQFGQIWQV